MTIFLRRIFFLLILLNTGFIYAHPFSKPGNDILPDTSLIKLSGELLYHVKTGEPTEEIEKKLAGLDLSKLKNGLPTDEAKKTFWLNIYNAWFQVLAVREKKGRPEIFSGKLVLIAGRKFSLDDIEHGILRKYRWKYSKGYFARLFPGKLIKQLAVLKIDYRIHFALNCGARSCPPIAFYTFENIDRQLDLATRSFLAADTKIDDTKKEIRVTKTMDWFIGDFGGKKGIRRIISEVLNKNVNGYAIKFKPYNWDEVLHNFQSGE